MLDQDQIKKIKEISEEFFEKMTMPVSSVTAEVGLSSGRKSAQGDEVLAAEEREVVELDVKADEPQILIGQGGQTLFEIQRLLKMVLNRKLKTIFYLNLDINDYKKKKIEYLKSLAKDSADHVVLTKEEKSLSPMSAYERRVIHSELSQRADVVTESQGEGVDRHIVIKPK